MQSNKTKDIVYIGLYLALTIVLDVVKEMIPFLNLPVGGSINIALIPVVIASLHLGVGKGFIVSLLWLVIGTLMGFNPYFLNPIQWTLDYALPTLVMGFAAIFYKKHTMGEALGGITLTMFIRTLSIVLSGVFFYFPEGSVAGSWPAWLGSLQYNLPYSIATLVVLLIVTPLVLKLINKKTETK